MATITVNDCSIRVTALLEYFEMLGRRKGGGTCPPGSALMQCRQVTLLRKMHTLASVNFSKRCLHKLSDKILFGCFLL